MDLFETLKKNLDFTKHAFTYSDSGKERSDVNKVFLVTNAENNSESNSSMENSENELAYLKKLDLFVFEKDEEPKKMESGDITKEHFSESSLNCGNYRGNSSGKKLTEILVDLTNGDSDFAGFLFKKSEALTGYVIFVMEDDKVVVKHVCLTTVLESNRDVGEEPSLNKVLTDKSLEEFIQSRLLNEDAGVAAAQNINTDTTPENFKTTNNFLVVLRLAQVLKGSDKDHFLKFDENVPSYQIRSLFSTTSVTKKKSTNVNDNKGTNENASSSTGSLSVKELKFVKSGDLVKLSGRVETENLEESCEDLEFVLMKNGESIFRGDAKMSEVKAKRSKKSGKMPKRNFTLDLEIEESADNCDATFELHPSIKCSSGDVVEGDKQDVTKHVKKVLGCDGEVDNLANNVGNNSNNNTLVESTKSTNKSSKSPKSKSKSSKSKSSKSKSSKSAKSSRSVGIGNNNIDMNALEPVEGRVDQAVGPNTGEVIDINENIEYDVKLQDIHKEGDKFYYIKNIYNIKGDKVEGSKRVAIPSDFLKSLGITEVDFKQDKKGKYRLDPNSRPSKSSRKLLEERLKSQVHKQVTKEGGVETNYLYEDRLSPAEKKRRDQMMFEKQKYEAKLKREEKHDQMKMLQFEKQREDQQAKREDQREREKMGENRKYAEMMMRMYNKEAQRRAGESKGKGDSGDKAMMERMMKLMAEQRREKEAKPIVMKEGKGVQMVPVDMGGQMQPVQMKQPKKSKSHSKDRKKLKKYKRLLRALKKSHKKKKSGKRKKPVSRKMRKVIIKEYRERQLRSRHGRRKSRRGSKASRHGRRDEERRHRRKSRSHGEEEKEPKKKHHKRSKHKKTKVEPEEEKKEKKVKTHKKK
jgi:hypothetical protein